MESFQTLLLLLVAVLSLGVAVVAVWWAAARSRSQDSPTESPNLPTRTDLANTQTHIQSSIDTFRESLTNSLGDLKENQGKIDTNLEHIAKGQSALQDTTGQLEKLLGSSSHRGRWGERMAEDIIRSAGLMENINYLKQSGIAGGGRPDFTFQLPDSRVLYMDVKFPLDNYTQYLEGNQDSKKFVADVKSHIKGLAKREYVNDKMSMGFVLMFLPLDSLYSSLLQEGGPDLQSMAEEQKVILCSPTTLFPILIMVRTAMDTFQMMSQGQEIIEAVGDFEREWKKYSDHVVTAEKQLNTFSKTFDALVGTRKRQLQRKVDSVIDLRSTDPKKLSKTSSVTKALGEPPNGYPLSNEEDLAPQDYKTASAA